MKKKNDKKTSPVTKTKTNTSKTTVAKKVSSAATKLSAAKKKLKPEIKKTTTTKVNASKTKTAADLQVEKNSKTSTQEKDANAIMMKGYSETKVKNPESNAAKLAKDDTIETGFFEQNADLEKDFDQDKSSKDSAWGNDGGDGQPKPEFDRFAKDYRAEQDKYLKLTGEDSDYYARYKVHKLVSWLPQEQSKENKILDFGCGDGLMTNYLAHYFNNSKISGVDISDESIRIARASYDNIDFKTIERKINVADNSYDIICSAGVFHHIKEQDHKHWISELTRVLKPGGICVIFESNPLNPGTQYLFWNHPMEKDSKMLKHWYTKGLLKKYGEVSTNHFCFFPKWFKFLRVFESLISWLPLGGLYACLLKKK